MQGTTPRPRGAGRLGRGIAIAAALSIAAVGSAASVAAQDDLDILKVGNTAEISTWDPTKSFSTEVQYLANIYEPLIWATPLGAEEDFEPGLATEWSHSEDGLTWTFKLKEGVTFHDGEPFNAEAAKASIDAQRSAGAGASWIWWPVESVDVVDEYTIDVNLSTPAALDLIAASTYSAWMVSPAALAAAAEDPEFFETAGANGQTFGTGPYTLESWVPTAEIVLTQFPEYHGGWDDANHYEKVLVSILDPVNQQQALEGGDVDLANRIPVESADEVDALDGFTVHRDPSVYNYVGFLNTERPPLDDIRVRQALAYATPYEDIITVAAAGNAVQDRATIPPGIFPYSEEIPQYSTDLDKAKELMAEAGVDGFPLEITYFADNPIHAGYAPLLQAAYAELGVDVTLTPTTTFGQQWDRGKGDPETRQDMFLLLWWPTYSDAGSDNLVSMFKSSEEPAWNLSYWVNEEFDALVDEAVGLTGIDRDAAQAKFIEATEILVEESPAVFFIDNKAVTSVADSVEGFEYNINYPFTQGFFYDLTPAA
jgi:peptide/nickel transport system substrate-binding protein